jgi:hypothetical protein
MSPLIRQRMWISIGNPQLGTLQDKQVIRCTRGLLTAAMSSRWSGTQGIYLPYRHFLAVTFITAPVIVT